MFPQRSTYRPVDGLGEYFSSGVAGLGAYYKPQYERPIAGLGAGCGCSGARGIGADNTVMTPTVSTANKTNAALLIGLGVAVIIGGVIFLGPQKKMHANARRKKRASRRMAKRRPAKRAKRRSGGAGKAGKTYAYWAKITRRDLDAGYLTPSEVDESLRIQYDKDEGDYRRDGITSATQFVKGVRSKL